jgi:hypothetical protein
MNKMIPRSLNRAQNLTQTLEGHIDFLALPNYTAT